MSTAPNIVTSKVRKYRRQEFWAENGLVKLVDHGQDPVAERVMTWDEALKRAVANYTSGRRILRKGGAERGDAVEIMKGARDMVEVATEARMQGDPTDDSVAKDLLEKFKKVQVSMAGIQRPKTDTGLYLAGEK